jgi:catechol 2,3-dioxygenase-like lactoylglutathione lyase family enzyme
MNVERIDHLVLTVADIKRTTSFYTNVLGMSVVTFDAGRTALLFGGQKINLRKAGREIEPKAANPTPGSADLRFVIEVANAEELASRMQQSG